MKLWKKVKNSSVAVWCRGGVKTLLSFRNYKKMIKKELEIRLNR